MPADVQHLWSTVEAMCESWERFTVNFPDDILQYLDNLSAPMDTIEAVELVYLRFLHTPCDPIFIEQAVNKLGAIGNVAVRLEILLMWHARQE